MLIHYLVLLNANICAECWRYKDGKELGLALEGLFSLEEGTPPNGRHSPNHLVRGATQTCWGPQRRRRGRQMGVKAADSSSNTLVQEAY